MSPLTCPGAPAVVRLPAAGRSPCSPVSGSHRHRRRGPPHRRDRSRCAMGVLGREWTLQPGTSRVRHCAILRPVPSRCCANWEVPSSPAACCLLHPRIHGRISCLPFPRPILFPDSPDHGKLGHVPPKHGEEQPAQAPPWFAPRNSAPQSLHSKQPEGACSGNQSCPHYASGVWCTHP